MHCITIEESEECSGIHSQTSRAPFTKQIKESIEFNKVKKKTKS